LRIFERRGPTAVQPYPADGSDTGGPENVALTWTAGLDAVAHKVYVGAAAKELRLLAELQRVENTSARLTGLEVNARYFWRIDEVQADGSEVAGKVWSFATGRLLAWWKFDDGAGDTAADSFGHGFDGKVTEADWVRGKTGGGLEFKGTGNVLVSGNILSALNKNVTITLWQYGDPCSQPQSDYVFSASIGTSYILSSHLPWIDSVVYWDAGDGTGWPGYDRISKRAEPDEYAGRWNHWAFTKDSDAGEMKIYLNGVLWHSGTGHHRLIGQAPQFRLGAGYAGILDDVRIYTYPLTAAEVKVLYGGGELIASDNPKLPEVVGQADRADEPSTEEAPPGPAKKWPAVLVIVLIVVVIAVLTSRRKKQ